jgi:hypothetical protein
MPFLKPEWVPLFRKDHKALLLSIAQKAPSELSAKLTELGIVETNLNIFVMTDYIPQ